MSDTSTFDPFSTEIHQTLIDRGLLGTGSSEYSLDTFRLFASGRNGNNLGIFEKHLLGRHELSVFLDFQATSQAVQMGVILYPGSAPELIKLFFQSGQHPDWIRGNKISCRGVISGFLRSASHVIDNSHVIFDDYLIALCQLIVELSFGLDVVGEKDSNIDAQNRTLSNVVVEFFQGFGNQYRDVGTVRLFNMMMLIDDKMTHHEHLSELGMVLVGNFAHQMFNRISLRGKVRSLASIVDFVRS